MSVVCYADGCHFANGFHVTSGHKCANCGKFGHGYPECGKGGHYSGQKHPEDVPHGARCAVPGCGFPHKHTTQGHQCRNCHKFGHQCGGQGGQPHAAAAAGGGGGGGGQVICHAPGCRFAHDSHVTLGHQCGVCHKFGHSNPECGKGNASGTKYQDSVPPSRRCSIPGCKFPNYHTLVGHKCRACGKFGHSCSAPAAAQQQQHQQQQHQHQHQYYQQPPPPFPPGIPAPHQAPYYMPPQPLYPQLPQNPPSPKAPPPCETRYDLIKKLGAGGFGEAWLVRDKQNGDQCVLKRSLQPAKDEDEKAAFINEVKLLKSCNHPNIVRCHGCYFDGQLRFCIVMELAPNGDLSGEIDKKLAVGKHFSEAEIMKWFIQLTRALEVIHSNKILHRDIKTANVFLDSHNNAKLGDFGIGKKLRTMQMAQTIVGTPVFMAPEIFLADSYSYGADIWSLGCLLYELCKLEPPYLTGDLLQLQVLMIAFPAPKISGPYSSGLIELGSAIFQKDPDARPTAQQILQAPIMRQWAMQLGM